MSVLPVAEDKPTGNLHPSGVTKENKPSRPKRKGPNYAQIHAKPLPLEAYPLPAFHPTHPISLLRLAYTWISHLLFPPSSHPVEPYLGYFSAETRSVHVTDPKHVRALWEMGFFGKGTLSRSEPSWVQREKARLRSEVFGGRGKAAAEDATHARREERRLFKLERARLERERIERQRLIEEGKLDPDAEGATQNDGIDAPSLLSDNLSPGTPSATDDLSLSQDESTETSLLENVSASEQNGSIDTRSNIDGQLKEEASLQMRELQVSHDQTGNAAIGTAEILPAEQDFDVEIADQEHLQLTFEEAFFLSYGLGVLSILPSDPAAALTDEPFSTVEILEMFCQCSPFPPLSSPDMAPDDQFLLSYVAYHHFRSLGWVVRPGIKFSVDYLLYNRGPVFSHAEFAVLIIPSYSERYWNTPGGRSRRRIEEQKDWWWLHCINRVQSQVKKTLVLCYIEIPSPLGLDLDLNLYVEGPVDIGKLLRRYKVREFVVRRWQANRSRD